MLHARNPIKNCVFCGFAYLVEIFELFNFYLSEGAKPKCRPTGTTVIKFANYIDLFIKIPNFNDCSEI